MNSKLNKSDYILLGIFYLVSSLLQVRSYQVENSPLLEYLVDIPTQIISSVCLIFIFAFWLIPNYIVKKKRYVTFVILGLLCLIFFGGIEYALGFWSGGHDWAKFPPFSKFIFRAIDFSSESVGFPLGLLLTKKFYEGQKDLVTSEKQKNENELKLLRSQLDPHFLFNNLNTLDSLIDSDPIKAKEYINRLSLIYRYLIKTKDAEVMELSEELELAENYIFLIKTRFGNDYDFDIINTAGIADKYVPTGSIQTLLENVVKHNKANTKDAIKTTIKIDNEWLTVANRKSNFKSNQESFGTGLENLKARYKLLSDKEIQIIDSESEYRISIPIIGLSNEV